MRTSQAELDAICQHINDATGNRLDFSIGYAYGRPRLYRKHQSVEVSPRLPTGQLKDWMLAYLDGMEIATNLLAYDPVDSRDTSLDTPDRIAQRGL